MALAFQISAVTAANLAGLLWLFAAGRVAPEHRAAVSAAGWGLLLIGLSAGVRGLPRDSGTPLWLWTLGFCGFLVCMAAAWRWRKPDQGHRPARRRQLRERTAIPVYRPLIGRRLTAAALGAVIYSAILGLAFSLLAPLAATDRALLAVVIWPLAAAGILIHLYTARAPRRAQARLAVASGLCAILAYGDWPS